VQIRSEILSKARISGSTVPKENGVTLVTAEHMDILNDKRSRKRANEMDFELTALPALLQTALDAKTPRTERSAAPYAQMRYPRLGPPDALFLPPLARRGVRQRLLPVHSGHGRQDTAVHVRLHAQSGNRPARAADRHSALREEAEYYGCTAHGAVCRPMQAVFGTYRNLVVHRLPRALFAHQVIGPKRTRSCSRVPSSARPNRAHRIFVSQ
jgi:hypothetical protein